MAFVNKYVVGNFIYFAGAYASYLDMNKTIEPIQLKANKKSICAEIAHNTKISHHYAKEYYVNHVHPVIYIGTWPVIQFTMGSLSLFTGVLTSCLEWYEQNKK